MPTRIIREGILTSDPVNSVSERAELFYRRLMSVADDYGRFFAHPSILRASCYPLRLAHVSENDVKKYLTECVQAGIIFLYDGGKHLQISKFKQQTRSASKFPEPIENELLIKRKSIDNQMCSESESESYAKTKAETGLPPYNEILDAWNKITGVPQCLLISSKRKLALDARFKNPFFKENWQAAILKIGASAFCRGENNSGWKASFDWFVMPDTVIKLIEGKYDDRTPKQGINPAADRRNAGTCKNNTDYAAASKRLIARQRAGHEANAMAGSPTQNGLVPPAAICGNS